MGWDVVQIGLKHDLPVDNPFETDKIVAQRTKRNIKLVYRNEYEYDICNNVITTVEDDKLIELTFCKVNDGDDFLQMTAKTYLANQLFKMVGIEKLKNASCKDKWIKKCILSDILNPFELYEIESKDIR